MNKNMRKMYTEEQLVKIVKDSGEISGGTQLYKHDLFIISASYQGNDYDVGKFIIINNSPNPIPFNRILEEIGLCLKFSFEWDGTDTAFLYDGIYYYIVDSAPQLSLLYAADVLFDNSDYTDTVTPL